VLIEPKQVKIWVITEADDPSRLSCSARILATAILKIQNKRLKKEKNKGAADSRTTAA
jgi:hypothetical protein